MRLQSIATLTPAATFPVSLLPVGASRPNIAIAHSWLPRYGENVSLVADPMIAGGFVQDLMVNRRRRISAKIWYDTLHVIPKLTRQSTAMRDLLLANAAERILEKKLLNDLRMQNFCSTRQLESLRAAFEKTEQLMHDTLAVILLMSVEGLFHEDRYESYNSAVSFSILECQHKVLEYATFALDLPGLFLEEKAAWLSKTYATVVGLLTFLHEN